MSDRKSEIIKAALANFSKSYNKEPFICGAEWADSHPDQERISKFTSNLMDENLRLTKLLKKDQPELISDLIYQRSIAFDEARDAREKLTQAQALLEGAKEMAEHYESMTRLEEPRDWRYSKEGGPPEISDYTEEDIGHEARAWLKEFETVMAREGMQK